MRHSGGAPGPSSRAGQKIARGEQMRQGSNQQDYGSGEFALGFTRGDPHHLVDVTDLEDSLPAPVIRTVGDSVVVQLGGEIDLLAFQRMAPLLDAVAAGPYRVVAIDLTGTTFFDCSGLSLILRTHRRARERGGRTRVVCRHRLTLRIIELAGLNEVLEPAGTVEEALR
ncbi:STAS domain-containing protein [Streptomyces sp. NPDC052225]|uniref:STAS domain-containing protein n=1 Tax=Streptomyces sp. NPDC052225 TaxID=3154949 RepID=UPI00344AFE22